MTADAVAHDHTTGIQNHQPEPVILLIAEKKLLKLVQIDIQNRHSIEIFRGKQRFRHRNGKNRNFGLIFVTIGSQPDEGLIFLLHLLQLFQQKF